MKRLAAFLFVLLMADSVIGQVSVQPRRKVSAAAATTPVVRAVGAYARGIGNVTPGLPAGTATGDFLVLIVESSNETIAAPAGWTQLATNSPQSVGGTCPGSGCTRLALFYRECSGCSAPTVTDTGNHTQARIIGIEAGTYNTTTPINVSAGGTLGTAGTSVSVPGATTTVDNCLVIAAVAQDLPDAAADAAAEFSGWTNSNLTNITERMDSTTNQADGGAIGMATGEQATAGNYGSTTATSATSSVKAYISIAVAPD